MKRFYAALLTFILSSAQVYAAGSFSTGILFGVAGDGGSVEKIAGDMNYAMRQAKAADPAAEVEEIPVYYTPAITLNFRYFYNNLLLQLGWEYAALFYYNESGSIDTTADPLNEIEIDYSRFTFPLSVGLVIPGGKRTKFYMAGGFNVSFVMLEITQSNPGTFSWLPEEKTSFAAYIPGFHLKFGAEAILSRNYSILFEYTRYMSKNSTVESESGTTEINMGLNTFEIAAGINYTVDTGLSE